MSLLSKLIKTGITAGAAYAAVKISEKYNQAHPEGVSDPAQKVDAIKQAASEFFNETKQAVSEKAPGVGETINSTLEKATQFAKEHAPEAYEKVQDAAKNVAAKAQEFADSISEDAVDADFTPVEEEENKENLDPVDVDKK